MSTTTRAFDKFLPLGHSNETKNKNSLAKLNVVKIDIKPS